MPDMGESKQKIDKKTLLVTVIVMLSMTFTIRASNNMFVTSVPLLTRYFFFFSNVTIGELVSIGSLATFVMSTFINARLESKNRRILFILSSLLYFVVFPFFAFSSGLTIWFVLPIATFTLGSIMPNIITSATLFKERKQRERILSIYTLMLSLSLIMGPLIEGELLDFASLKTSFLYFSILPGIAFLDSFFIKFPNELGIRVSKFDFSAVKEKGFIIALLNILAYNIPFAFLTTYGGLYGTTDFGLSYSTVNLTFSTFFLTSFLSRLLFSIKVPEKLSKLMYIAVLLSSIGLVVLGTATSYVIFVIAFLILGIPHGLTYPLSVMSLTRSFPENRRSIANSYFFSIMMAIGTVMPFISGEIILVFGYRHAFLVIIPVILILMVGLYSVLRIGKKKDEKLPVDLA
jgi:MFS family permease